MYASAPNVSEKYLYLKRNINFIATYQGFSILFMLTGLVLFIYSYYIFYIFIPYFLYLIFYFICSFYCNIYGKDFDLDNHLKLKEKIDLSTAPSVDIYLPCCGESLELLENTYKYVKLIDYNNYKVYVLDDSNNIEIKNLAIKYNFNYISRPNRPELKKAGNLRYAFKNTTGEFYLVLDADFCPRSDIINELIIYLLNDPNIAIVQSPQYFRATSSQNWVERGAGLVQELFYRMIQTNRNRFGASICVGTSALYRREALIQFGGAAEIEHSEDLNTGFNVIQLNYKVHYISLILSTGICPDNLKSFFNQQYRWGLGSTTLLHKKLFWKSKFTLEQKICYLSGMLYYYTSGIQIFINPIFSILLVYIRPEYMFWYNLVFAIPSLLFFPLIYIFWSSYNYKSLFDILKIQIVQSYAHLFAVIDRASGNIMSWNPTNSKSIENKKIINNYTKARILAIIYTFITFSLLLSGTIYRSFEYKWYNFVPSLILMIYHIYLSFQFMIDWN